MVILEYRKIKSVTEPAGKPKNFSNYHLIKLETRKISHIFQVSKYAINNTINTDKITNTN